MDPTALLRFWESYPAFRPIGVLVLTALVAALIQTLIARVAIALAARTVTDVDDRVVAAVRPALVTSVVLIGLWVAIDPYLKFGLLRDFLIGLMASTAVLAWAIAANASSDAILDALTARMQSDSVFQPRTLPLFRIGAHILVWGGAIYAGMLAWGIDVSAWLASAGIIGVAFGFAAKDTLANLFAGVFIIADRPYRVGDFLTLDTGERGRVTEIGFRSTRLVTLDDIEIVVPNALMANVRVINESGGPRLHMRVRNLVTVGYGVDLDHVQSLLLEVARASQIVNHEEGPIAPRVRVRALGPNGIEIELQVWVLDPELKEPAMHEVLSGIYKRLRAEGIPISYAKQDLYVKELPSARFGDG